MNQNETPRPFHLDTSKFNPKFADGLARYFEDRIETGSFLRAVLENDLKEAVARADERSRLQLPALVDALRFSAPAVAWGSREKVAAWLGED